MGCDRHIGGRPSQQDRTLCCASPDHSTRLLVVADGVGGHWGGELAAQTVVDVARSDFETTAQPPADPPAFLEALCQRANAEIRSRAGEHDEEAFSTIAALLVTPERAYWAHVGDSRLYCFRDGQLVYRTRDHSMVQAMVDGGELAATDMADHPDRNQLLQVLGMEETVRPAQGQMSITPRMTFVLCSDGFWDSIEPRAMVADIRHARDLPQAASAWVHKAVRRGGEQGDNVSLAVWRSESPGWLARLLGSLRRLSA